MREAEVLAIEVKQIKRIVAAAWQSLVLRSQKRRCRSGQSLHHQ